MQRNQTTIVAAQATFFDILPIDTREHPVTVPVLRPGYSNAAFMVPRFPLRDEQQGPRMRGR
jgi:hypothetical protein